MNILTCLVFIILQSPNTAQPAEPFIQFKKGACMGQCPVYNITVDQDGKLTFKGIRYTKKEGEFQRVLSKKEFRKLKRKFRKSKLKKFDDTYGMDVMDASLSKLTINKNNYSKTIQSKISLPEKLQKAHQYLISLTPISKENSYEWTVLKTKKQNIPSGRKEMAAKEIILELEPNIEINMWLKKYNKYGVRLNKKLVPNRPLYLLRYDPKTIQIDMLLEKMNIDSNVKVAEINKKVEMRR